MSRAFTVIDAPQRSEQWFAARLGRLTGSVAGEMLATLKGGAEAAGRRNLRLRLVLERLTQRSQDSDYVSPAMQAGIDREALAFAAFEAMTGEIVLRSGFLAHTEYMAGASLDGHMGDFETLLSIKCRQPAAHYDFLKSGTIPADALAQMTHELWITGATEHRYFSWNPDFPEALQSRVVTVHRAAVGLPSYEQKALAFLAEVETEYAAVATLANPSAVLREAVA
jgi:predicted phage-related endonuclease